MLKKEIILKPNISHVLRLEGIEVDISNVFWWLKKGCTISSFNLWHKEIVNIFLYQTMVLKSFLNMPAEIFYILYNDIRFPTVWQQTPDLDVVGWEWRRTKTYQKLDFYVKQKS